MVLLDLLGRRWALRILWELRDGPLTFRALQAACGNLSPSVLNDRLRELREAGILELREPEGYGPTAIAEELGKTMGSPNALVATRRAYSKSATAEAARHSYRLHRRFA